MASLFFVVSTNVQSMSNIVLTNLFPILRFPVSLVFSVYTLQFFHVQAPLLCFTAAAFLRVFSLFFSSLFYGFSHSSTTFLSVGMGEAGEGEEEQGKVASGDCGVKDGEGRS